jgi:hypothetical protein
LWLEKLFQRAGASLSEEITQTSEGFLLLQSITCWRTSIEPVSCWARGAAFWLESEARVQIAPSGMIKKRKVGFSIAVVPVWRLVNERFKGQIFPLDVVNCFIGFVASIFWGATKDHFRDQNHT